MNRFRKHGNDIGDIASFLVTKWKELLKQEPDASQISSSEAPDKGLPDTAGASVNESDVDSVNNKHVKSKDKTPEIKSKVHADLSFSTYW